MSKLDLINSILHGDFSCTDNVLEEPSAGMKISITSIGCRFLLYKFDKTMKKEYKGGLFPFFAKNAKVCSICDYILFSEFNGKLFVLILELKKGKNKTRPQLEAAKCFVNYIISTLNRVNNMSISPEIRLISIHEYKIKKKPVGDRGVVYDKEGYYQFKQSKFEIRKFLIDTN